jgi:hypothetical protein
MPLHINVALLKLKIEFEHWGLEGAMKSTSQLAHTLTSKA